jgi:hypothetical protein
LTKIARITKISESSTRMALNMDMKLFIPIPSFVTVFGIQNFDVEPSDVWFIPFRVRPQFEILITADL